MACFHPLDAFRRPGGGIGFGPSPSPLYERLQLPCGQCSGCRIDRSRQWAIRCMHEAQLHSQNSFITLTYNDEHLPKDLSLNYEHFQLFMKRLRKHFTGVPIRYYMCGEYGENFGRPHFHACLFGLDFADKEYYRRTPTGDRLYTSKTLETIWGKGFCPIGEVTFQSAAYVARYIMKKRTGSGSFDHYNTIDDDGVISSRTPEFNKMSLKPGIGAKWFEKFHSDVFPHDHVILKGKPCKPPRYYDKLSTRVDRSKVNAIEDQLRDPNLDFGEFANLRLARFSALEEYLHEKAAAELDMQPVFDARLKRAKLHASENTAERLKVRKEVFEAQISQLPRKDI